MTVVVACDGVRVVGDLDAGSKFAIPSWGTFGALSQNRARLEIHPTAGVSHHDSMTNKGMESFAKALLE
jgi:hypothetical protein